MPFGAGRSSALFPHVAKLVRGGPASHPTFVVTILPCVCYTPPQAASVTLHCPKDKRADDKTDNCKTLKRQAKTMAKITVNGNVQEVETPITVAELIKLNNVLQPEMVSVQVNEEFVDRTDFDTRTLNDGDSIDFLYFMGGGQF